MSKARILIIDDDKQLVERYQDILDRAGYETDYAYDGKEGLKKLKQLKADAVILDLKMPKMGGVEVLEAIRDDASLKETKVLVISSYAYKEALVRRIPQSKITRAGKQALEKGTLKRGWDGKLELRKKPEPELKESILRIKTKETPAEFRKRLEKWLLEEVDFMLKAQPGALGREKKPNEPNRVLIVDDDEQIRKKVASWLKPEDYELTFAANGTAALEKIASEDIDLVILDLMMPETTGEEVIRIMGSIPIVEHIPIIVLTSVKDTTRHEDLFGVSPNSEIIDEDNIRSRIRRYKRSVSGDYDKPPESRFLSRLHIDKPASLINQVKKELAKRQKLGYGYKDHPITIIRNKKGEWLEGYLEAFKKVDPKDREEPAECCYCKKEKTPAYKSRVSYEDEYLCQDCVEELKTKHPGFANN